MDGGLQRPPGSPHRGEITSHYCNRESAKSARLLSLRCKGLFLRGNVSAFLQGMHPSAQTECLPSLEGCATASGVESTHIRGEETTALMPRKNLLSLFAEFTRFGGDVAVVQKRGYRREKLTYSDLYTRVLYCSYALGGHGVLPGDRVLLW